MSYLVQTRIAQDPYIMGRAAACAAAHGIPSPSEWAWAHAWQLSAQPGWAAAYTEAEEAFEPVESDNLTPGALEEYITDAMILTAVQALRSAETGDE